MLYKCMLSCLHGKIWKYIQPVYHIVPIYSTSCNIGASRHFSGALLRGYCCSFIFANDDHNFSLMIHELLALWVRVISPTWACNILSALFRIKSRFASSMLSLRIHDRVSLQRSGSGVYHVLSHGSILRTCFPVGFKACEGLLEGILEAFLLPTNWSFAVARSKAHHKRAVLAGSHRAYILHGQNESLNQINA